MSAPQEASAGRIAAALEEGVRARRVREVETGEWTWLEIELHDERYPLTVDLLASKQAPPSHILYMLPGAGLNFRASFMSPLDRNLAQFMRKQGALVIGVSWREDKVPADRKDYRFMAEWGLRKHRGDLRALVGRVQSVAALPYQLLGHGHGAACALDYAAHHSAEVRRTVVLDMFSLDPERMPERMHAERTYAAYVQCMAERRYCDGSRDLKRALVAATRDPASDSAFSRAPFGHPANFSARGALDFSLVHAALMPGLHSPITGLRGDWPLIASHLAGNFQFAEDPRQDVATFVHVTRASFREAAGQIGGGAVPVALLRDYWAVNAGNGAYDLPWAAIKSPVVWVNAELGYGDKQWGAHAMRRAGNASVVTRVIAGYGHADLLWGERAASAVWDQLLGSESPG